MEAFTQFPLLDPWCEFSWKNRAIRYEAFKNGTASNKQDASQTPTNGEWPNESACTHRQPLSVNDAVVLKKKGTAKWPRSPSDHRFVGIKHYPWGRCVALLRREVFNEERVCRRKREPRILERSRVSLSGRLFICTVADSPGISWGFSGISQAFHELTGPDGWPKAHSASSGLRLCWLVVFQ